MIQEPDAYAIGWVPFLGTTIWLDSHPLIPRPETEWWVEQFLKKLEARSSKLEALTVLDLFAGSGCVGIAVLKHTQARVDFGELETRHLATISKNLSTNAVTGRVIETNVYSNITDRYDFILANPPYLAESRRERVQDTVLVHEPHSALFANDDGFALIEATIRGAPLRLAQGGQLWIEHEPEHSARIHTLALTLGISAQVFEDQYGVERYSVILVS